MNRSLKDANAGQRFGSYANLTKRHDINEETFSSFNGLDVQSLRNGNMESTQETNLEIVEDRSLDSSEDLLSNINVPIDDSVKLYLKEIGKVPLLKPLEELEIAKTIARGGRGAELAKAKLTRANLTD